MTTTKSYDKLNRLTTIAHTNSSGQALSSFDYVYNTTNQCTKITREDKALTGSINMIVWAK